MAEVLLVHHILGLTPGVQALAERWRAAGHTVHTPDLFDGHRFGSIEEGAAYLREIGSGAEFVRRGVAAAENLPDDLVHAGISLGVMPAQTLVQTRPGAAGCLFLEACGPVEEMGGSWPAGLPCQVHGAADDEFFGHEGDKDAAEELVARSGGAAELFVYPGSGHLFTEGEAFGWDDESVALLHSRVDAFLAGIDVG